MQIRKTDSEADFSRATLSTLKCNEISRRLSAPAAEGAFAGKRWFYERAKGQYRNEVARKEPIRTSAI